VRFYTPGDPNSYITHTLPLPLQYVMLVSELNFLLLTLFFLFVGISLNVNTALHLLLTAEFLWVTLYSITVFMGFIYDNVNLLSLTFFFLILSAVEFGIGLVLILLQSILSRSINLGGGNTNAYKFSTRALSKLIINKYVFL